MRSFCRAALILLFATAPVFAEPISRNEIFVKDGDTIVKAPPGFRFSPNKEYRLVGFDTPETARGRCPSEIERGNRATARLISLLETGKLDLTEVPCSCCPGTHLTKDCNAGRRCGRLSVDGKDVGEILIAEGHAVPFICSATSCPQQQSWCQFPKTKPQKPKC